MLAVVRAVEGDCGVVGMAAVMMVHVQPAVFLCQTASWNGTCSTQSQGAVFGQELASEGVMVGYYILEERGDGWLGEEVGLERGRIRDIRPGGEEIQHLLIISHMCVKGSWDISVRSLVLNSVNFALLPLDWCGVDKGDLDCDRWQLDICISRSLHSITYLPSNQKRIAEDNKCASVRRVIWLRSSVNRDGTGWKLDRGLCVGFMHFRREVLEMRLITRLFCVIASLII